MANPGNGFSVPIVRVHDVVTSLGLITNENWDTFIKRYPTLLRDSYIYKAEAAGASKYTPNEFFRQWEDPNKPQPSFQVTAAASGAAGAAVTVVLTADSHTASGTYSPIAEGFFFVDDATGIEYEVRSVDKSADGAHEATIAPTSAADSADITEDSFFKFVGRPAKDEDSDFMDGIYRSYGDKQRQLTIIRTDQAFSDLAAYEIIKYGDTSYYNLERSNLDPDHVFAVEHEMMLGRVRDNVQSAGNRNVAHQGMLPQIQAGGYDLSSYTAITDAFWQDITRVNDADGWTNEYDILADTEFYFAYQQYMQNVAGTAGSVIYGEFNGNNEINLAFNFGGANIYGTQYNVKKYAYFNSGRTHGATPGTGYLAGTAVFIPQGTFVHPDAGRMRYFTVRYMSDREGGQRVHYDTDGALFGKNGHRRAEVSLTSYKGLEMYNLEAYKYAKITP